MRPLVAHCHLGLSKLYRRTGKREEARNHLTTATTIYRERCNLSLPLYGRHRVRPSEGFPASSFHADPLAVGALPLRLHPDAWEVLREWVAAYMTGRGVARPAQPPPRLDPRALHVVPAVAPHKALTRGKSPLRSEHRMRSIPLGKTPSTPGPCARRSSDRSGEIAGGRAALGGSHLPVGGASTWRGLCHALPSPPDRRPEES
jgi:hypothetical protein